MSLESSKSLQLPIRCFLSYARADDEALNFIVPLKKSLEHFCFSNSGRRLEVFLDRESVGWGENWRDKIVESLDSAMVFIPVISLQYFDREACRSELQAFHATAKNLGVTELLLPLIVLGRGRITDMSDDPLVRMVEELQNIDIETAVMNGPDSAQWRMTIKDAADKLVLAVEHAENAILERDSARPSGSVSVPGAEGNEFGLYELNSRMQADVAALTEQATEVTANFTELAPIVNAAAEKMKDASAETVRGAAADLARDIEETTLNIQRVGGQIETTIGQLDADLRQYYSLVMEFGTSAMKESVRTDISNFGTQFSEIRNVTEIMTEFIAQIQPVEVLSAPLKHSLRPLRTGVNSIQVAMSTMESWTRLGT